MAFDEKLAGRIRGIFTGRKDAREKKMFGGIAFMLNGNMCCGVINDLLMARVGADRYEAALSLATYETHGLHGQADERVCLCRARRL